MKFQPGHKFAKGGKRPGAGRPSKEEADFRARLKAAVEEKVNERVQAIAARYVIRATGNRGDKVLMHLIDRAIPAAKTQLEVTGKDGGPIRTEQVFDAEGYKQTFSEFFRAITETHAGSNGNHVGNGAGSIAAVSNGHHSR